MTRELTMDEILSLIDWQRSMGVDCAIAGEPTDWLEQGAAAPGYGFAWPARAPGPASGRAAGDERPRGSWAGGAPDHETGGAASRPATRGSSGVEVPVPALQRSATQFASRPATPLAPSAAETEARRASRQASTLEALEKALRDFDGCGLKATATNLCFYRGAPQARLMLIGEAPGRDEDLAGKPFVGRAGQLLDKMLAAIGLDESQVHITNIVYWRPPGNRTPTPQEALACRPFLERQMELVRPDAVVVLGGAAAKEVFAVTDGIMRLRGKWRQIKIGERLVPAVATLHPAYLLRTPAAKQLAWADLLSVKSKLAECS